MTVISFYPISPSRDVSKPRFLQQHPSYRVERHTCRPSSRCIDMTDILFRVTDCQEHTLFHFRPATATILITHLVQSHDIDAIEHPIACLSPHILNNYNLLDQHATPCACCRTVYDNIADTASTAVHRQTQVRTGQSTDRFGDEAKTW